MLHAAVNNQAPALFQVLADVHVGFLAETAAVVFDLFGEAATSIQGHNRVA
jgi:hypothetical protein